MSPIRVLFPNGPPFGRLVTGDRGTSSDLKRKGSFLASGLYRNETQVGLYLTCVVYVPQHF